ncbi:YkvA family protein [Methylobrevis pamukkalensis]|uniref:DUF1232 domain-containing protein n=1 Tax=Methylobrevis pamukkalensis TaxID=1439726 RepID=A0A1E3H438_9HYPH|nr:YkvA family protein [Methylobrevis pamukkalensis]ODN70291.1 hypothetical protein A6302_02383 [Methylobrevis pamukkalensis]
MPATKHFDDPEIIGPEKAQEDRVRRDFWKVLRRAAGRIPFVDELVAAYYCALDPKTPLRVRATLIGALAYFVMPIDVIPDFLVFAGFTDDVTVLAASIAMVRSHINDTHRAKARDSLK